MQSTDMHSEHVDMLQYTLILLDNNIFTSFFSNQPWWSFPKLLPGGDQDEYVFIFEFWHLKDIVSRKTESNVTRFQGLSSSVSNVCFWSQLSNVCHPI